MKWQTRSVCLLALLLSVTTEVLAASPGYPPVTIANSELRTLESKATGRSYDL